MKSANKIFLIGPMGAGKSTIGRLLSRDLGLPFKDSDREIEERTGADIPWVFDVEGEDGFRDRESKVIDELSQLPKIVLATGGGAVLREENRRNLSARGTVVYLETSIDHQYERTHRDKNRPLLQRDNPREVLEKMLAERDPLYREVADVILPTHQGNPKSVVRKIKSYLEVD